MSYVAIQQIKQAEVLGKDGHLIAAESILDVFGRPPHSWVIRLIAAQALIRLGLRETAVQVLRMLTGEYLLSPYRLPVFRAAIMLAELGFVDEALPILWHQCFQPRHCCTSNAIEALARYGQTSALRHVATEAVSPWTRTEASGALSQERDGRDGVATLA